jgi:hypothetical protein
MPLKLELNLRDLPVGRYECQLSLLDPTGQKAAFWRAPIAVVQ